MKHPIDKSMATLAFTQNIVDKLHAQPPQNMAQPSPQQPTAPVTTPQPAPQATPQPAPQAQGDEALIAEANSIKELDGTLASGFEAVSKLADAMKEVTGVKKTIAKRIKDRLQNGQQTT